jgi:hypothetical protein
VSGSTQMPAQLISFPGHETWQVPLPQTLPTAHETPELPPPLPHAPLAPQLLKLVAGSIQTPPQLIWLPGQETWHVPFAQTFPLLHAVPGLSASPSPHTPSRRSSSGSSAGRCTSRRSRSPSPGRRPGTFHLRRRSRCCTPCPRSQTRRPRKHRSRRSRSCCSAGRCRCRCKSPRCPDRRLGRSRCRTRCRRDRPHRRSRHRCRTGHSPRSCSGS